MIEKINAQKDLFILEEGVTYLNCSYMSPMLKSVRDAGLHALEMRASPWNLSSGDWFTNAETLRSFAANIFKTSNDNIALIPSASYGLAIAGKNLNLKQGKEIIILEHQYPSNYYIWEHLAETQKLQMVVVQKSETKTLTANILEKINANTGIIAIPNCHWIDGAYIDLQQISDAAKQTGSYFVLDLSQSLGVLPIDIEKIDPDFAVSVGYKWMLGPYSLGYLYVSKRWQQLGEPLEYSWATRYGSENFTDLTNYVKEYRDGARKFDMGEFSQINLLPMAIAALQQINNWQMNSVQSQIKKLTDKIITYKKSNDLPQNDEGVGHIINIPVKELNINTLRENLKENKVVVSFRGSSIRVSPHLYNTEEDIEKLFSCLDI